MAAEVAHEVKSPLTAVKGAAGLLERLADNPGREKVKQYRQIVTEEIDRVENMLSNLQDLAKPLSIDKERLDINSLIRKTIQLASVGDLDLTLSFSCGEDIPEVEADPSLLKQVILNIIRNASDACGKDGRLEIKTLSDHESVRMEFTDNGPGISREIRSRIFEPFFTTKESGLGLGLLVSSRIVVAHGGRIVLDNVRSGGARVTVVIPR